MRFCSGVGRKPTSKAARVLAQRAGKPFVTVEDGFLRSAGRGDQDPPLSLVLDASGIYYEANSISDIERIIAHPMTLADRDRTTALIDTWRQSGVSKYNHARNHTSKFPDLTS